MLGTHPMLQLSVSPAAEMLCLVTGSLILVLTPAVTRSGAVLLSLLWCAVSPPHSAPPRDQVDGSSSSSSSLMTGCHFYSLPPGCGAWCGQDAHYTGCGVTRPACHTVTTSWLGQMGLMTPPYTTSHTGVWLVAPAGGLLGLSFVLLHTLSANPKHRW